MTAGFIDRLKLILTHYELSSSAFADKIEVPRSSMSHLLSGRNKPSLDFVLKVISKFPDVDLYWLLKNEGAFPSENKKNTSPTPNDNLRDIETNAPKKVSHVMIFYNDGTFESYHPNK